MIIPQVLVIPVVAASNTPVSTTRINTAKVTLRARTACRVGFATFNPQNRTFTAPTDPLSDSTQNTISLAAGETFDLPIASWQVGYGEKFNLQHIYAQGTDNNVLEVHYQIIDEA